MNYLMIFTNSFKISFTEATTQLNCMSPQVSEEKSSSKEDEESGSDEEQSSSSGKRKIVKVCPLSWRNERFLSWLRSLDRKFQRKISERARSMIINRRVRDTVVKPAPADIPGWMVTDN